METAETVIALKMNYTEQNHDYSGNTRAPTLTLMVGVSGSGKSVLSRSLVNKRNGKVVRFNRDSIRAMLYADVPWNKGLERLTRNLEKEGARMALLEGKDVIIDDTNCSANVRDNWAMFAHEMGVHYKVITMTTPLDVCIQRDSLREGKECVGEEVIRKQWHQMTENIPNRANNDRESLRSKGAVLRLPDAPVVICDVDGTLADHRGVRSPFDESKVLLDGCHTVVRDWVKAIYPYYNVVIVSGRHAGCCEDTMSWLKKYEIPYDFILMRPNGDYRSDVDVKAELFASIEVTFPKEKVAFVLDDRPRVIRGWKKLGLTVYPVAGTTDHSKNCTFKPEKKGYRNCTICGAIEDF